MIGLHRLPYFAWTVFVAQQEEQRKERVLYIINKPVTASPIITNAILIMQIST